MNRQPSEIEDGLNNSLDANSTPYDQERNNNARWMAGATVVMLALVAGTAVYATNAINSRNAKIEAKNALNEGQLRERGFDDNGIEIDVSGDTDVITIGCPGTVLESTENDQTRLSYIYDAETMAASWEVASQLDQSGQVVATFEPIVYPLGTKIQVAEFIDRDLAEACGAIASN